VTPDAGFVVEDQSTFTLDPGDRRSVVLKPAQDVVPHAGQQPGCTVDRKIADKEYDKPFSTGLVALAVLAAFIATVAAVIAARTAGKA
jgi:hypothetical protein